MDRGAAYPDLRAYLAELRRDGDLAHRRRAGGRTTEAAEIDRRVIAAGGPALLFPNVGGAACPLVTNLFGTRKRVEMAFGRWPLEIRPPVVELAQRRPRPTLGSCGGRDVARASRARGRGASALRPRGRSGDARRAPGPPARDHELVRGRRPVRDPAARLHRAARRSKGTTSGCTACRSTTRTPPACTGRSARAAGSTTRWPRPPARRFRSRCSWAGRRH